MPKTYKIQFTGQVQGVGFRPFVYNLAHAHQLNGTVCNDENGVLICANGTKSELVDFMKAVLEKAPETAIIRKSAMVEIEPMHFEGFFIVPSKKAAKIALPLTSDFAICDSCKKEVQDENNRRYRYPFTTCTQCGPRYAITESFPFEREHTSMNDFTMCEQCRVEYENPNDLRFHSQTNGCGDCGVRLHLADNRGKTVIVESTNSILGDVAGLLRQGNIVAIKNTNGYLLCADATNSDTVKKLRERKRRPTKPFALLYPDLASVKNDHVVSLHEQGALTSKVCPIVLLEAKAHTKKIVAKEVAHDLDRYGVMLPSSALLTLLSAEVKAPLVATSGNIHGSPILSNEKEAMEKLSSVADYFVHHDLNITFPQDDSVCQFADEERILLRRSRGMAPNFMTYEPKESECVLAMGAHLKSTLAFAPNGHTYVSPYFGNLDNFDVSQRYTQTIQDYIQLFETLPQVILVDGHPSYQSTLLGKELADNWKVPVVRIQHHKAHFASVLAEHGAFDHDTPILGVVWDGTGLGDDGMIWGGEFFVYKGHRMERMAHLDYFDALAGDKMAKEPRLSLLSLANGDADINQKFSDTELNVYRKLKEVSRLKTSSMGRLFDAVASLLGILDVSSYEGEAALGLENLAWQYDGNDPIDLLEAISFESIPSKEIIATLITLRKQGEPGPRLAASFIHALAKIVVKMALRLDLTTIACSGGVFQNRFLVQILKQMAKAEGLQLMLNRELSSNDENIALGQLAYYQHIKE